MTNLKLYTVLSWSLFSSLFRLNIETIKRFNFRHSALFCRHVLQAECHWRVNYVYAFSPLYFFPSLSLFFLPLSPDACKRADARSCVCVCVCVCKRTCAGFVFLLNIPLMLLFIYLFLFLRRPFLCGWGCSGLGARCSECHPSARSRSDGWTGDLGCRRRISSELETRSRIFFVFKNKRRGSVTRRASSSSPTCLAEHQCASHVKQLFHLQPGGVPLLWFPNDKLL